VFSQHLVVSQVRLPQTNVSPQLLSSEQFCFFLRYGSRISIAANASAALQACPLGSFVINECTGGSDAVDESACTTCNSNCKAANYSRNEDGQYIQSLCDSTTNGDNTCAKCSGRCLSFAADPPGQYIRGFCNGMTQFDRQCASCRISCNPGEYIAGARCSGETDADTTHCQACTQSPSNASGPVFTLNPCTGRTSEDQTWQTCSLSCPAGEYVSRECSETTPTECTACKSRCPVGHYLSGSCDGTSKYVKIQCLPCKSCAPGEFRGNLASCNGSTPYDTVQCTACRSNCSSGQYVFGLCSGLMSLDETSCKVGF
jgi:hypothetical protein